MFANGSGGLGSFHADVLGANPSDDASKRSLIEEIKGRAKSSITNGNFPEAVTLYTKAIEVCPAAEEGISNPPLAILHANRSMCHLSMNKTDEAIVDADAAVALDADYLKAYYRQATAHMKKNTAASLIKAEEALRAGLAKKEDDKELVAQMNKLQQPKQPAPAAAAVASSSSSSSSSSSKTTTTTTRVAPSSSSTSSSKSTKMQEDDDDNDEDEVGASSSSSLRGYKTTSDGRKTTFFNNELDEQTKALIGNIAPKKLEAAPEAAAAAAEANAAAAAAGSSAWNAAGTFESVDFSPWAFSRLSELLVGVAASGGLRVSEVDSLTGDAQIICARGKRKHVYDYVAVLKWQQGDTAASGTIEINDITADGDYEFEVKGGGGAGKALLGAVSDALNRFREEFRTK